MLKLELSQDDLMLIREALDDEIDIAESVLQGHIDEDQTPETLDDFLAVVSTAQEHVDALKALFARVQEAIDGN